MFWGKKSDFFEGGGKMKKKNQKSILFYQLFYYILYIIIYIYIIYSLLLKKLVEQNQKSRDKGAKP